MKIRTVQRAYDDNGLECNIGDTILIQTVDTDNTIVQATIKEIMTSIIKVVIDDRALGYVPVTLRPTDIVSMTLYARKPLPPL